MGLELALSADTRASCYLPTPTVDNKYAHEQFSKDRFISDPK